MRQNDASRVNRPAFARPGPRYLDQQEKAMGSRGPKAKRTCSDDELKLAIANSRSIAGVLRSLGLRVGGANYKKVHWYIRRMRPDISHWTGAGHRKGSTVPMVPAMPLD